MAGNDATGAPKTMVERKNGDELNKAAPCGLARRLMVMLYDSLAVVALLLLATGLALLAGSGQVIAGKNPWFTLYLMLVWFAYLGFSWRRGMTVGMRAWGVEISDHQGGPPGWGRCLLRFLVSLVSAAALGLGFFWSLFDEGKRCWHDMASHTRLRRS